MDAAKRLMLSGEARLTDATAVAIFKEELCRHGCLGRHKSLGLPEAEGPLDRLRMVPLAFGLLPTQALVRQRIDVPVKPLIRAHLASYSLGNDEDLVSVLKSIADQHYFSGPNVPSKFRKTKKGMRDLRANRQLYVKLRERQRGRCRVCGIVLEQSVGGETLDHIIPFRLVGDIADGSNYQVLCAPCNTGKGSYLSTLQQISAFNWHYGPALPVNSANASTRYVVLAQRGACSAPGCGRTPESTQLIVQLVRETGMWLADNLEVRCKLHGD